MECGALFGLLKALRYISPEEYRAGEALAYQDCRHVG